MRHCKQSINQKILNNCQEIAINLSSLAVCDSENDSFYSNNLFKAELELENELEKIGKRIKKKH